MKISIIGAGRSGLAAAKLARSKGYDVFLSESKPKEKYAETAIELEKIGVEFEFGTNTNEKILDSDRIILSPGVPPTADFIVEAEKREMDIISELEFAWEFTNHKIIAITGTNGKTTTTALTGHILQQAGVDVHVCGNIGTPLSAVIPDLQKDSVIVLELSSYQLDRTKKFRPDVAIILNLTPDHLSYHGSLDNYREAKYKITANQTAEDYLIINGDDDALIASDIKTKANLLFFSVSPLNRGIYTEGGTIKYTVSQQHKTEELMAVEKLSLPGIHNTYNSMAAALAARVLEIRNENIRDSLMSFQGVEHRLEFVRSFMGVDFVNDSKATNINATWYALSSYKKPIIWIAGGRGDNNDYSQLDSLVDKNVKSIIAIGEEADAIFNHFCLKTKVDRAHTLEEAVRLAAEIADFGELVLFTPACKSFDMFDNFEHRGQVFKSAVNSL